MTPPTREQREDVRADAEWTLHHVGAPGCQVRLRAAATLALLDDYERLLGVVASCPDCTWEIE